MSRKENKMAETKKKAKLSIEENIARREEMAEKNSNELKVLKRKLGEQKRKDTRGNKRIT